MHVATAIYRHNRTCASERRRVEVFDSPLPKSLIFAFSLVVKVFPKCRCPSYILASENMCKDYHHPWGSCCLKGVKVYN